MKTNPKTQNTFSRHLLVRAIRESFGTRKSHRAACGLVGAGLLGLAASGAVWTDFPAVVELSELDGSTGFALNGINDRDFSGMSVSGAGDVNGDGVDDLIIGAPGANYTGQSHVVFGRAGVENGGVVELSKLDGSTGFALNGINDRDYSGTSVSGAGDVNGDGVDDLIIGAPNADPNSPSSGQSYVVFGGAGVGNGGALELSKLDGSNGFVINGINRDDEFGFSVSNAGDVNGDGVDDLIIGARNADPNGIFSGQSYVVFGGAGVGSSGALELSKLDGSNGFAINGANPHDIAGFSVSGAGDVNGDGVNDLIIGAWLADPNGIESAGQSYVVFGRTADSGPGPSFAALRALGDTNGDGTPEIAVVAQADGQNLATV